MATGKVFSTANSRGDLTLPLNAGGQGPEGRMPSSFGPTNYWVDGKGGLPHAPC